MSNARLRPRIVFDENGICNACNNMTTKQTTNWESRKEFIDLIEPYKSKDGSWDCVVPEWWER